MDVNRWNRDSSHNICKNNHSMLFCCNIVQPYFQANSLWGRFELKANRGPALWQQSSRLLPHRTARRDKKALLSFMYNAAFNKGHTQSQLWVNRFSVTFSFLQSLICQSLFPQVCVFLAFFISLSVSPSSPFLGLWPRSEEYSHHALATDLTGNSFNIFQ